MNKSHAEWVWILSCSSNPFSCRKINLSFACSGVFHSKYDICKLFCSFYISFLKISSFLCFSHASLFLIIRQFCKSIQENTCLSNFV